ncbi:MAG: hypothetical protein ACOC3T_06005, partial [Bacteroidota bacterium]
MKKHKLLLITSILILGYINPGRLSAQQRTAAAGAELLSNVDEIAENAQEHINKIDAVVDQVSGSDLYKTVIDGFS